MPGFTKQQLQNRNERFFSQSFLPSRMESFTTNLKRAMPIFLICTTWLLYMVHQYNSMDYVMRSKEAPHPIGFLSHMNKRKHNHIDNTLTKKDVKKREPYKIKKNFTLLIWSDMLGWRNINMSRCQYNTCHISKNRNDLNKSDMVLLYGPRIYQVPPSKRRGQIWIFSDWESPAHIGGLNHLHGKINWTWTYRRDSDIVTPYGNIYPSKGSAEDILPKNKSFAWIVSNCNAPSQRNQFVNLMKKLSAVDVYGKCGKLKCRTECYGLLKNLYNYYLSFENSICKDYVTEKMFRHMLRNVVPVGRGGANYSMYFPPGSYIDTNWYKSVQNLTQDLLIKAADKREYSKLHKWRQFFNIVNSFALQEGWCDICRRLHSQEKYRRIYENIQSWWRGNGEIGDTCQRPTDIH